MNKTKGIFGLKICGLALLFALIALGLVFVSCEDENSETFGIATYYTVNFDLNGGYGTMPMMHVPAGSSIILPDGDGLSKDGYTFGGWNTNASGTGTNYSAGSSYTVNGYVTLYAKWNAVPVTYTVTFDNNGGDGTVPDPITVQAGGNIPLPGGDGLTRDNYTFGGWINYYGYNGTETYQPDYYFTPTNDTTLYAKWDDARAEGAAVSAPTGILSVTSDSITINPVDAPENGQAVEYAISTSYSAPSSDWQTGTTFSGLTSGTTYYIFARSAENNNCKAGTASAGYQITTQKYSISLNPSETHVFTAASFGYGAQNALDVTVSNAGNQATGYLTIALSVAYVDYFTLSTTSIDSIAVSGNALFTVVPIAGLNAGTYTATITVSGANDISASLDVSFTVNRAAGAAVNASAALSVTSSSIAINPVTAPENGQAVEYAVSTSYSAPSSGWQYGTTFSGLMYGTTYYIFARSMENANYYAGASSYFQVTTTTPAGTEEDPFPLTEKLWEDGSITTSSGVVWYSFTVAANTEYRVWWNQSSSGYGDGTKTARVNVTAYDGNRTQQFSTSYGENTWSTPRTIAPKTQGTTIYLRVALYSGSSGTFAIGYSTGSLRSEFRIRPPVSHTPLNASQWTDGSITNSVGEVWYSFTAAANTNYGVWWNDSSEGDNSKTLNVQVRAYDSNGTQLFNVNDSYIFNLASTFNVPSGGTIYLRVLPNSGIGSGTGTFAIGYSAGFIRWDIGDTPLTADQWINGSIGVYGETWYSFNIAANTEYRVWWNQSSSGYGDGTKTARVNVTAYDGNRTQQFSTSYGENGWSTSRIIAPKASGTTIYLRVTRYSGNGSTFGIVYSVGSTRPSQ